MSNDALFQYNILSTSYLPIDNQGLHSTSLAKLFARNIISTSKQSWQIGLIALRSYSFRLQIPQLKHNSFTKWAEFLNLNPTYSIHWSPISLFHLTIYHNYYRTYQLFHSNYNAIKPKLIMKENLPRLVIKLQNIFRQTKHANFT